MIVGGILASVGLFFQFAPKAPVVVYAPVEVTGSSLTLGENAPGQVVNVSAEVKRPGFVTVHQAIGEAPGPIIGTSELLEVGGHAALVIHTDEPLQPPAEYFVLLFVDDGDGVYEPGVDLPVMSNGQVIKQKLSL